MHDGNKMVRFSVSSRCGWMCLKTSFFQIFKISMPLSEVWRYNVHVKACGFLNFRLHPKTPRITKLPNRIEKIWSGLDFAIFSNTEFWCSHLAGICLYGKYGRARNLRPEVYWFYQSSSTCGLFRGAYDDVGYIQEGPNNSSMHPWWGQEVGMPSGGSELRVEDPSHGHISRKGKSQPNESIKIRCLKKSRNPDPSRFFRSDLAA